MTSFLYSVSAEPTDTSVDAVGHPKHPAKKTADPGSKPPPSNQPVCVPCSKHWRLRKQTDMDYHIDWGVTNSTLWTCKLPGAWWGRRGHVC